MFTHNDYAGMLEKLGSRESRKLANNTYAIRRDPETIAIKLHSTDVVTYHADGTVTLRSGGWETVTTKDRINSFGPDGIRVYSTKRVWHVHAGDDSTPFVDGMRFDPRRMLETTADLRSDAETAISEIRKLSSRIDRYVANLKPETLTGLASDVRIDLRSVMTRGCPRCKLELALLAKHGRSAIAGMPSDHLIDHMTVGNHSPALIIGALVWSGYRLEQIPFVVGMPSIVNRTVKRYLKARICKAPSLSGSEAGS